ncbi:preprotein translocase subunit SecA [Candidatus Actinomarina sp.]|nr:preprotein translocase subunit SecA [Candidatus Actinomarina sp.]MDA8709937.1 preprotein translocase subunit SecA [Candidatus Actinomarina sp.]MDB3984166.1 preprotein translocase subunit SecA [Acidimicrobiia bacterium]
MSIFKKVLSVGSGKLSTELNKKVEEINSKEQELEQFTDEEIKQAFHELKKRIGTNDVYSLEVDAFALTREAAKRTLGQRHYDVQLFGGMVLLRNKIAEMKTGEGKTLVSTLPIALRALYGKGVHVVTVNDYLAKRDAEWMTPIYNFLGLEVGLIYANQEYEEKRAAYRKDITYGTNNEFGFDYLRDNMAQTKEQLTQSNLFYSVIDEVDSILVDEARTPLIISGRVEESTKWYIQFSKLVKGMKQDVHYEIEESKKQIHPTEIGIELVEKQLGIDNLYEYTETNFIHYLTASLRAKAIYVKDVDYIVEDRQLKIVDEFTGRVLEGRRYSDGLHQALEAKEGLQIQDENQTLASITYQNYFRMYENLSGMTGTAKTEEDELIQIYNLEVIDIPTNVPIARDDKQDAVYKTRKAKINAVIQDINNRNKEGQPILLGTVSVESSEELSKALTNKGIKHSVLNAKNHEQEASIVAQAGRLGSVTVATNMAGRGVDIKLGGNPEEMAFLTAKNENKLGDEKYLQQKTGEYEKQSIEEKNKVLSLGGLYVLGTERHESRRIDNQLRGRSGRQGDPGESRFYISLEDDLMRRFQGERIQSIMDKLNLPDEERIEQNMVTKSIERAQAQVESLNFEIRKNVLKFDQVLNQQREVIYKWRRNLLTSDDISDLLNEWFQDVKENLSKNVEVHKKSYESLEQFKDQVDEELNELLSEDNKNQLLSNLKIDDSLNIEENLEALFIKNEQKDSINFWNLARAASLSFIDQTWKNHLSEMDYLRSGIGLRAMGQRDPLVEYQKEGYDLFEELIFNVKTSVVRLLLNFDGVGISRSQKTKANPSNLESNDEGSKDFGKIGRNDPCPCGSGKKYKKCKMVDLCSKN